MRAQTIAKVKTVYITGKMSVSIRILATLGLLFLGLGLFSMTSVLPDVPSVSATSTTIALNGSLTTGWNGTNPGPTITVGQGTLVTMKLVSADGAPHTFVIDVAHAGVVPNPNCSVDKCSPVFSSTIMFSFTANMQPGTYTYYCSIHLQRMIGAVVVQASSGGPADFTATASPTSLNIAQGSSGSATITLSSINAFSGTVALSVTVSSNGPQSSLSPPSLTLTPNGSASTTLSVSAGSSGLYSMPTAQGSYTVTLTETSGSVSHSTLVTVNIGATSQGSSGSTGSTAMPASSSGVTGTPILIGAVILVFVVVVVAGVALTRRRGT